MRMCSGGIVERTRADASIRVGSVIDSDRGLRLPRPSVRTLEVTSSHEELLSAEPVFSIKCNPMLQRSAVLLHVYP